MLRTNLFSCVTVVLVLVLWGCGKPTRPSNAPDYNIMLIAVDTLRADHLSCYGYEYPTSPNIDEFAKKSQLFEYAYCPIPKTSASFASMLTGLHPFVHKTKPNRGPLGEEFLTLAESLKSNGYQTAAIVDNSNLSSTFQFNQGFDTYTEVWNEIDDKSQSTPFITEKILAFLDEPKEKPFFLWVNYIEPHTPYVPPEQFIPERPQGRDVRDLPHHYVHRPIKKEMADKGDFHEGPYIARYDGAVQYIDAQFGKIIESFHRKKLDRTTILIFIADHGEDLGERNFFFDHGPLTFSAGIRVPLILYVPNQAPGLVKTPVSTMDVFPTLHKLLQIPLTNPIDGIDLFSPQKDRRLYIAGIGSFAVIKGTHHYIHLEKNLTKWLGLPAQHLYDVSRDPHQINNHYPSNPGLAKALETEFLTYRQQNSKPGKKQEGKAKKLTEKEEKSLKTLGYL